MRSPLTWRNRDRKRPDLAIARDRWRQLFTAGGAATAGVYDLARAMPISALDDFETRMASPAASISRHFEFTERERMLLQARATADARARSFQPPLILIVSLIFRA